MSVLILVGGLPGSGKSSLAEVVYQGLGHEYPDPKCVSADDFFYVPEDGEVCSPEVRADPSLLRGADLYRYRVGRSLHTPGEPETYGGEPRTYFYKFDRELQPHAHIWCQEQVRNELARTRDCAIVIHNTFTQRWEMEPYIRLARDFRARLTVTRLYDGGCSDAELAYRNSHGVPEDTIARMRGLWETDWRNGDPTPPRDRPSPKGSSEVQRVDPFEVLG